MAGQKRKSRLLGVVVGLIVVGIGIASVILYEPKEAPEEPVRIRPLKTVIVGSGPALSARRYPGRVAAKEAVDLAFQVSGPLIELPVRNGQEVQQGDLLARIDPRDYENQRASAQAEYNQTEAQLARIEKAAETGAVSQADLTNAKAAFEMAEARLAIAKKAAEDTNLYANFEGVVARTYVENYQNVMANQRILSLQDISEVEVVVSVPERRVAEGQRGQAQEEGRFAVVFDFLPEREFPVTFKEFATEADPRTQTYAATFVMPSPEDVMILPGMTATLLERVPSEGATVDTGHFVPADALAVDSQGQYYVWQVEPADEESIYVVQRRDVTVGDVTRDSIHVVEGLQEGLRIAAAGVHVLKEGQKVRLYEPRSEETL
jgi:RND family efflux transporter MFP subunit